MTDFSYALQEFENALTAASKGQYVLRLYVTGSSPISARAVKNIRSICERYLRGRYELTIIDVLQQPELAVEKQLVVAPTLVKERPSPVRRLVGDLSDEDRVLSSLNISAEAAS